MTFLEQIVDTKREEVKQLRQSLMSNAHMLANLPPCRGFKDAIAHSSTLAVVAEVKKASPSKGVIQPNFDPVRTAMTYQQSGAAAISVLTDQVYFKGSIHDLRAVRQSTKVPVLRKDFILDEAQIVEARLAGADAVLLICSMLTSADLVRLAKFAKSIGLDTLMEVHHAGELDAALAAQGDVIGINNRNLHSFEVSLSTTADIILRIPSDIPVLSESGISTIANASFVANLGVNGILVGESLMRKQSAIDVERTLQSFQVPRVQRVEAV